MLTLLGGPARAAPGRCLPMQAYILPGSRISAVASVQRIEGKLACLFSNPRDGAAGITELIVSDLFNGGGVQTSEFTDHLSRRVFPIPNLSLASRLVSGSCMSR